MAGVDPLGQLVDVLGWNAEGLPQVADASLHLVGGYRAGQGGPLPSVPLVHAPDRLLPDIAREVDVYVWRVSHLVVYEAVEAEAVQEGIDVRQPDQVTHEHGDRRAAAAARGTLLQRDLGGPVAEVYHHLPGDLDHLVVDQEEARQLVFADQAELLVEPLPHFGRYRPVLAGRRRLADLLQVALGGMPVREVAVVGKAVPKIRFQVEVAALGYPEGVAQRLGKTAEVPRHLLRRPEVEVGVGPPLPVCLLQGLVVPDGDESVLEPMALGHVIVDVVGRDNVHSCRSSQSHETPVPGRVAVDQVLLKLDEDVVRSEPLHVAPKLRLGGVGPTAGYEAGHPALRAAGEKDQPPGMLLQQRRIQPRVPSVAVHARPGRGEQVAEVGVATTGPRQEGQVGAVREGYLRAGDGLDVDAVRDARELHRPAQVVVIGQGQRRVPELDGAGEKLLQERGALLKGVVAMAVQLDIVHES